MQGLHVSLYPGVKRLCDFLISAILLIVFLPLAAVVALCVRVDSSGPIFFFQTRVGRRGRHFRIIKFRTMVADAESIGPLVTSADDPRMTKLGRILRATKIDELPQLLNVLYGDMSLVGPRPQVPRYVEHFPLGMREVILSVEPGITGPTAIRFRHEESILDNREDREDFYLAALLPMKCGMDVEYVTRRGFWRDVLFLIETLSIFIRGLAHRLIGRPFGSHIDLSASDQAIIAGYEAAHGGRAVVYADASPAAAPDRRW